MKNIYSSIHEYSEAVRILRHFQVSIAVALSIMKMVLKNHGYTLLIQNVSFILLNLKKKDAMLHKICYDKNNWLSH